MNILILDDNQEVLVCIREFIVLYNDLYGTKYKVFGADSIDKATTFCVKHFIDHLILDISLGERDKNGFTFAYYFRKQFPKSKIHVYTGLDSYTIPKDLEVDTISHKPYFKDIEKAIFGTAQSDTQRIRIVQDRQIKQIEKLYKEQNDTTKRIVSIECDLSQVTGDVCAMKTKLEQYHTTNLNGHNDIIKKIESINMPSFKSLAGMVGTAFILTIGFIWGLIVWQSNQTEKLLIMRMDLKDKIIEQSKSKYSDSLKYSYKRDDKNNLN